MLLLLPVAVSFAQIISPYSDATPIMKYPYVLVYAAVLLCADLGLSLLPRPRAGVTVSWGAGGLHGLPVPVWSQHQ